MYTLRTGKKYRGGPRKKKRGKRKNTLGREREEKITNAKKHSIKSLKRIIIKDEAFCRLFPRFSFSLSVSVCVCVLFLFYKMYAYVNIYASAREMYFFEKSLSLLCIFVYIIHWNAHTRWTTERYTKWVHTSVWTEEFRRGSVFIFISL